MDTSVRDRMLEFIQTSGLTKAGMEKRCGMSNGYINSIKNSIGTYKLEKVLKEFPDLNKEWLLYGEGEMLRSSVQTANGDNNTQIAGNNNNVNLSGTLDRALGEIAEQRKLVAKAQEQIDRLISLLEKMR